MPLPPLSLAAIRQPAFLYDADGRIAEANDLAEALAGRPLAGLSLAAAVGVFDARSPGGAPLLAPDMPSARALRGEKAVDVPLVVRAADGRILHVLASAAPLHDGDRVVGALSIWQDVSVLEAAIAEQARLRLESDTRGEELEQQGEELRIQNEELRAIEEELLWSNAELQAAQDHLSASEEQYRSLAENVPSVLMRYDAGMRVVYLSARAERFTGIPASEFIGRTNREVGMPGDLCTLWETAIAEVFQTGEPRDLEFGLPSPGGALTFYLRFAPEFGPEGDVQNVLGISTEITDRKRAEEDLRRSEEEYRHIVEHAPTGIYEIDYTGPRFRRVNDAMCEILGYTREELMAMDPGALLDEESRERFRERVRAVLAGEPIDASVAFRLFAKDGREIWGALEVKPTFTDGRMDGALVVAHDITERRRMEEALRESEANMARAQATAHLGNWEWDLATGVLSCSDEHCRLYGLPPGDYPIETFIDLVHEDDRQSVRAALSAALSEGKAYEVECRVVRPDGAERILHGEGEAVRDRDGRPAGMFGIAQDITERVRAEEAMAAARGQLQSIIDNTPAIIYAFDLEERFIMANTALAELFKTTPEAMMGKRRHAFMPVEDADWHEANDRTAIEAGQALEFEEYSRIGDRSITWLTTKFPLRDSRGRIFAVAGISSDITGRKRAEEALREAERHLARAQEIAHMGSWSWDIGTDRLSWSAEAYRILGLQPEELSAPVNADFLTFVHPDDRERVAAAEQDALADGSYDIEFRFIRKGGDEGYAHTQGVVTFANGAPVRMEGIVQDITERKAAEEALREYAENLARSNEDLERFAYVSSHDLQEPLRAIVSFSQLLERRYRGRLGADADEYIDFIVEGGNRMQSLIQDLLAYSRVNTTRQRFSPTDTADVLASVERSLDLRLRESGATLTHDPMPVVMADPIQLEQVFANLVSNAIKFSRPDEPLRIHVGARRLDSFWEFSVSDNGIGIEPEYFEKIFVIFQRLHTKDAYPGTGIGLAIVKRIIDRHGGRIRVESTPGEGSTFYFTLPAA